MNQLNEEQINVLKLELPNLDTKDIFNLIASLQTINTQKRDKLISENAPEKLEEWIPNQKTVIEVINNHIHVNDIKSCINDFLNFASKKDWKYTDNLDPKFITHVKIMIKQSKVKQIDKNSMFPV